MRVQGRTDVTTMDAKRDLKHKNFLMFTGNTCTLEMFPSTNVQNVKKVVARVRKKPEILSCPRCFAFCRSNQPGKRERKHWWIPGEGDARDGRPISVQFLSFPCSFRQNSYQIIGFCPGWRPFSCLRNPGSATGKGRQLY